MKNFQDIKQQLIDNATNNRVATIIKENPVASAATASYIAVTATLKIATGTAVLPAIGYAIGTASLLGACYYGATKLSDYTNSKKQ